MSLYHAHIDLSSNDGGIPRDRFVDGMRVRLMGGTVPRKVSVPAIEGAIIFVNDCDEDVSICKGAALRIKISRGEAVHVLFDGTANGMIRVG